MVTVSAREKRHRKAQKPKWNNMVPSFSLMDYALSMVRMMTFFAEEVENKEKQEIAIAYWKERDLDVNGFGRLADYWFVQVGPLCWMADNNIPLEQEHLYYIENKYRQLCQTIKQAKAQQEEKPVQDAAALVVQKDDFEKHLTEIDTAIDSFLLNGTEFNVKNYLAKYQVSAKHTSRLHDHFKKLHNEAKQIQTDEYVKESYDYMTPRKQKKYLDFLETSVSSCLNAFKKVRMTKAPKARKEKPAGVLVAKLNYQKDSPEFNIKSESPTKLIGASEVWVFSTKYRKLFVYRAQDGLQLSVKGTTLLNWNPETSFGKILRKPMEILPSFANATRRPLKALFDTIKTSTLAPTGRFSDETVILKVF